jgi:hypothetical protein
VGKNKGNCQFVLTCIGLIDQDVSIGYSFAALIVIVLRNMLLTPFPSNRCAFMDACGKIMSLERARYLCFGAGCTRTSTFTCSQHDTLPSEVGALACRSLPQDMFSMSPQDRPGLHGSASRGDFAQLFHFSGNACPRILLDLSFL